MSTSTYAFSVHTTSQHEEQRGGQPSHSSTNPSALKRPRPGLASRAATSPPAHHTEYGGPADTTSRPASSRDIKNALRIEGSQSRVDRTLGPVPQDKKRKQKKKVVMGGPRVPTLQTNGFPSPTSPLALRTPLSARPSSIVDEIFNGLLLPLPFIFASLAFPTPHTPFFVGPVSPSGRGTSPQESLEIIGAKREYEHIIWAGALSSAALLLVGTIAKLRLSDKTLDRRKRAERQMPDAWSPRLKQLVVRMLSLALPFYACMQLDGLHVALFLLVTIATGLGSTGHGEQAPLLKRLAARPAASGFLALLSIADFFGLLGRVDSFELALGYLALSTSAFATPPPFPYLDRILGRHAPIFPRPVQVSSSAGPTPPATPHMSSPCGGALNTPSADASLSITAGLALAVITAVLSYLLRIPLTLSTSQLALSAATLFSTAAITFFSLPVTIGGKRKPSVACGLALVAAGSFLQQYEFFDAPSIPFVFSAFCVGAYFVSLSSAAPEFGQFRDAKRDYRDTRATALKDDDCSIFTKYVLSYCAPGSMLETILSERDSRRIAYFACLNLGFMFVQFFYGFVTGSLGLLTDSIHMLFDCLGLAVGLAAAVMSKWPPTLSFPYGYGRVDTLSGFANGIFLMLVSIEIVTDAMHRLHEGHELRHLNELLVVSILGFMVNIIGLTAFGHAHHGHGHGHGHSHGDTHSQSKPEAHASARGHKHHEHEKSEHSHSHTHSHHDHAVSNGAAKHDKPPSVPQTPFSIPSAPLTPSLEFPVKHGRGHSHDNENMQGIFLHVLADTLGSVAVIISTLLTKYDGWSGWDPLASCGIAILIFLSAIPLVKQSGMKLLLALPSEVEYSCRDALQGLSELRGIVGYAGVRVWQEERCTEASGHDHHHHHHRHHHDEGHGHGHGHEHGQGHDDHHRAAPATLSGVIHVIAAASAELEDVGERASQYLKSRDLDLVVHVEREGPGNCWCGGVTRQG